MHLKSRIYVLYSGYTLFRAGVDTSGQIFSVIGIRDPSYVDKKVRSAMNAAQRYMWAKSTDGQAFDAVVTTMHHSHALHAGTRADIEAPLHGFLFGGTLFLDPSGSLCEPSDDSILQPTPADRDLASDYAKLGLLPSRSAGGPTGDLTCLVGGHTFTGVTSAAVAELSSFLLHDAAVRFEDLPGNEHLRRKSASRGHLTFTKSRAGGLRSLLNDRTAVVSRELGKSSVAQSSGIRKVLFMRVVWSDQSASDAMDETTYAAYASSFVTHANNRSYGHMVIVPTYTPNCVYVMPSHTKAESELEANADNVAGWIFTDKDPALAGATAQCVHSSSDFQHVYIIIINLSQGGWAGIGFQPGSTFIVKVCSRDMWAS